MEVTSMTNATDASPVASSGLRVINGQLPVLNNPGSCGKSRPFFGDPEVASYGAVGLDLDVSDVPKAPEHDTGSKSPDGKRDVYRLSPSEPLGLPLHLGHHEVDGRHLWIAVEEGKLIVTDDLDHEFLKAYMDGCTPLEASARVGALMNLDGDACWKRAIKFLGRLAAAGFIRGIRGYHTVKKIRPYAFARLHLTQRCQLECIHCYTNSSPHLPRDKELSKERWIRLVEEFADNGGVKILFTGGEALVHPGCIAIMRRAHERKLEVTLFSNGILIPRYIHELKEIADIVQISVDGPDAETHDAVRGPGSFKQAMRALHLLLDSGIRTRVSTTIMMNTWPAVQRGLPGFIAAFENTDLSFRISYGAMSHGRGTNLDHSLDTESVRSFVDNLLKRVKTNENNYEDGPNAVTKISGCGYAEQLVVAPDGFVYPCHLMSGALGHVDDLPIRDITRYLVRTAEAFSVDHRKGCSTCDLRNLCGGSCRVDDEKRTGSRLITTCTPEDKLRKKRFLVERYQPV
jgi:radical SAM protein with 4Fe4S-binding SPASM domain